MKLLFFLILFTRLITAAVSDGVLDAASSSINAVNTMRGSNASISISSAETRFIAKISTNSPISAIQDGSKTLTQQNRISRLNEDGQNNAKTSHFLRGSYTSKAGWNSSTSTSTNDTIKSIHAYNKRNFVTQKRKLSNIRELFNKRIDEWELQDWIMVFVMLFVLSIVLRVLSRIHCCGCSALDCLAGFLCWQFCCDPTPGMNYAGFA
jgi:hypothetical protein